MNRIDSFEGDCDRGACEGHAGSTAVHACTTTAEYARVLMPRLRAGFTLVEVLVAMTVFSIVIAVVLSFMSSSMTAFAAGTRRVEASQTLLFVTGALQRDLRTIGTNVPAIQPALVYAGEDVVAFNSDYVSNVGDPFAVMQDPDAPAGEVSALMPAAAVTVPGSTFEYPDTTYTDSPAELIMYYFRPDSSTERTDDYVLLRRVNAAEPELISANLLEMPDRPFFQYLRLAPGSQLIEVPSDSLPLAHSRPIHLSPADTGRFAVVDSIRGIRINLGVTNGREGDDEQILTHRYTVWLRNAGLATQRTCGSVPLFGGGPLATLRIEPDGTPVVDLTWGAATDETGGEEDVVRYVIWRTPVGEPVAGDPWLSIPAGSAGYAYTDRTVQSGESWQYSIAAQDCTPSLSPKEGTVVVIPVLP